MLIEIEWLALWDGALSTAPLVQLQYLKGRAPLGAKDLSRLAQNHIAIGQFVHGRDAGVGRADLEQRLGPETRLVQQFMVNELPGTVVGHGEERADKIAVVPDDFGMKVKNAHAACAD